MVSGSQLRSEDDVVDYDVVVVADLRAGSPVVGDVADALAGWSAGSHRIALVQNNRTPRDVVAPFAVEIRSYLDRGRARLLLPHESTRASAVAVWQPEALAAGSMPAVEAQDVLIVSDEEGIGADEVRRLFGADPVWVSKPPAAARIADRAVSASSVDGTGHSAARSASPTVLMVSSNGTGMGHLTRLLAYSRKAQARVNPHFLSLSQGVPVVADLGFSYEYVPSVTPTGMAPSRWRNYLAGRLCEAIERLRPSAVVFDGAWAYDAIADAKDVFGDVRFVWSRRGMWYRGMNRDQLAKRAWFDAVIEPGDFASPVDPGVTASEPATRVGPVTLLDEDELLTRSDARKALGLEEDVPTALVMLGAGNISDATSDVRIVIDALRGLGLEICVTVPAIAERASTEDEHVHLVTTYPLARHLRAFDVAVSAAGYNSYHELLRFGVPTLFLPNLRTSLDDQRTRAKYAADKGWAACLDGAGSAAVVSERVSTLLEHGPEMVAGVVDVDPGNGARRAMDVIVSHALGEA